jgi:hypothetical protein
MLYYNFSNFEEFKERFGIQEHANGEKSRKNKILLAFIKNKELLHEAVITGNFYLLHITDMSVLKKAIWGVMENHAASTDSTPYKVELADHVLFSSQYETDEFLGICADGDMRSVRYVNHKSNDRVFKMKAGKFLRTLILDNKFGKTLPEQVVTYMCEEFSQDWQVYCQRTLPENKLFVTDEFARIYDSDEYASNTMHSCMVDKDYYGFYENAVAAKAAYLENDEGEIIARCIIFTEVHEVDSDKIWRLAERQYAIDCNDVLKRALVDALIREGYIDGYKRIGADCGDSKGFVDNDGNSLSDKTFYIDCNLSTDDPLSYMDSFKWYNYNKGIAYNNCSYDYDYDLATTEGSIEGEQDYDDYHDYSCNETTLVYVGGREYYCDRDNLDDFEWIDSRNEYHHKDDIVLCADTEEYELYGDTHYSELTEEYYSRESAMLDAEQEYKESNWAYSEFDDKYYADDDEVVTYQRWNRQICAYEEKTIFIGTLINLVRNEVFFAYKDGKVYNMLCHGQPLFMAA